MTVNEIVYHLKLQIVAGNKGLNRLVQGVYISDLLSNVIAKAKADMLWLTIQVHQNIIAVAVLKNISAIILMEGRQGDKDTLIKANVEGIPLLLTNDYAFELAGKLHNLLL